MQGGKVKKIKNFLEKDTEKEKAQISPLQKVEPLVFKNDSHDLGSVALAEIGDYKKTPETYWFQELRGFDPKVLKKNID